MFLMNSSPIIACCCQSPIVKLPINIKYKNYTTSSNLFLYNPTVHNNSSSAAVFVPPLHALPGNSSEQKWTHEGLITESLPDLMFRVRLDNGDVILGYLSGKMKQNHIRILVGDKVKVEVSRYDSTRGRITYRQDSRDRVDKPPKKIKRKGFQDNKPKR